jgi:hypothetical protein
MKAPLTSLGSPRDRRGVPTRGVGALSPHSGEREGSALKAREDEGQPVAAPLIRSRLNP